jgi:HAD superfamily hydrolase (TIGR01549 family)
MTRAVFFDLYGTLARFWPPREALQAQVAQEFGWLVSSEGIHKGYLSADEFMEQENARLHIQRRSAQEQGAFFARYEQLILAGAGVEVPVEMAAQVWARVRQLPYQLEVFEDAVPALQGLKERKLVIGLISNMYQDIAPLCQRLGIAPYLDFVVTSKSVGAEKPHSPIFLAALEHARVAPGQAMLVGDSYTNDVLGARAVGITGVLLDREGEFSRITDCPRITSLGELAALVEGEE